MNEDEYRLMRRRLRIAEQLACDAVFARMANDEDRAVALDAEARRYAEGARELISRVRGLWVLALPVPLEDTGFKRIFIGPNGRHVENPADAETYPTFDEARTHSVHEDRGVYYTVEPLDYHLAKHAGKD